MAERIIRTNHAPGVVLLTMNRPDKLNAMDPLFFRELRATMADLSADDTVRAAVLTGAGRAFSAGGDIDSFHELDGDTPAVRRHLELVYDAFCAVERCAVPVLAAVNGLAYGGGSELTLACDIALAGTSATFGFREPTVGLTPGFGVIRAPQVLGRQWANLLAATGRIIDADTALRAGLVVDVVAEAELLPTALGIAAEIAANPTLAVRVGKRLLHRDTHGGFGESVEAVALLYTTTEHRERVAAFRARHGR